MYFSNFFFIDFNSFINFFNNNEDHLLKYNKKVITIMNLVLSIPKKFEKGSIFEKKQYLKKKKKNI